MTAEEYYQQGNAWRKQGDFKRALDCYMEAISLDPESPAVAAKEMLDDIMSFIAKTTTIHNNRHVDSRSFVYSNGKDN